jgi:beta-lactamase regulating signal transducer with metallopeptidase domain
MPAIHHLSALILDRLLWTSLQAFVLVGIVMLALRLLPRLPAAARCALWWLVGLQVVLGLAWIAPIRLPLLTPSSAITVHIQQTAAGGHENSPSNSGEAPAATRSQPGHIFWRDFLVTLWALGLLAQLPMVAFKRRGLCDLLRDARPSAPGLREECARLARQAGLRRCPRLLVTRKISAPLVTGCVRPVILWPDRQALTAEESSLALAHELAHVKRGDLWAGLIPALAQRLFFFHPLVRWAVHEYAAYREAACDAAAVRDQAHGAQEYGALLLRLGVSGTRDAGISATSETFRNLKLRLTLLRQPVDAMLRTRVWILIVAVALLAALPYRVVATNGPAVLQAKTDAGQANTPVKPPAKCGVRADNIPFCGAHFLMYMGSTQSGRGAVLFDNSDVIIAGDHADVVSAKRVYRPGARLLWFRHDGKPYVTRDASTLRRAEALILPIVRKRNALFDRRGKLVEQQRKLQAMRGALVAQQGKLIALRTGMSGASRNRADPVRQAKLQARIRVQHTQIKAMQASLRTQRMNLKKREQAVSDKSNAIPDGLTRLAADALASGTAQPIDR